MKILGGLLMITILLTETFPALAVSVQISPAKKLSVSGGRFSPEINWSRRAPKANGCMAPDLKAIELNQNVFHSRNSHVQILKGIFKKFFFKKSGKLTPNSPAR